MFMLSYEPGDVAVVYPLASRKDVDEFLVNAGWLALSDECFQFEVTDPREYSGY